MGADFLEQTQSNSAWVGKDSTLPGSLDLYLEQIRRRPLLSNDEQLDTARRSAEGCAEARKKLVEHNLRLVVRIAKMHGSKDLPLADLIQEGNLGLIRAAESFDYRMGFRFSTYAALWIKQAISRAIETHGRSIRLPSHLVHSIRRLRKFEAELMNEAGRDVSVEELGERANLPVAEVVRLMELSEPVASLEQCMRTGQPTFAMEKPGCGIVDGPEYLAMQHESCHVLTGLLSQLNRRERDVIERRFGLRDGVPVTLAQIGEDLRLTRERVRQLERRAILKMRELAEAQRLDEVLCH